MKNIAEAWDIWQAVMEMIQKQFGDSCEVVLHDLTKDYEHTIVDIRNGHITGRKIGGCGSNLGLEVLSGNEVDGNRFNYVVHTRSGKILRSSSIYMHDDDGNVIGSLCINQDITDTLRFEQFLRNYNNYEIESHEKPEFFAENVNQLLDYMCLEAERTVGVSVVEMSREEKSQYIGILDKKGAFLITGSVMKVCEYLRISKYTFYNYLEKIRGTKENPELEGIPIPVQ